MNYKTINLLHSNILKTFQIIQDFISIKIKYKYKEWKQGKTNSEKDDVKQRVVVLFAHDRK